jgi:iron(III) transport system substrate-binding protein
MTTAVPHARRPRRVSGALLIALLTLASFLAAACGDDDAASEPGAGGGLAGTTITVYSGREEELLEPVFEAFEEATGAKIEARYGGSAEMALLIDTEGDRSPADVFISQSPGAVGFLDQAGRLQAISQSSLARVDEAYRSSDGRWVGITGRVRVLVYNTELVDETDLPASVLDLTDSSYNGKVAVAPSNGSFQDFITAMRSELGDDVTADWLRGMAANNSPNYAKNSAIVDAVARGEVAMGLVNHYYLVEALEEDPDLPAANYVFPEGDLGSLLIVTAAGILDTSDDVDGAQALIEFLLSDEAQALSANGEKEYPLVDSVPAPEGLEPLESIAGVVIDLDVLAGGLAGTADLIDASGIIE